MAIGIRKSDLEGVPCKFEEARFCRACEIVTERLVCPLCEGATVPHLERSSEDQRYCVDCADPFPDDHLRVKTWSFAPHDQCEGDLVCVCQGCLEEDFEGGNSQAIWKD